MPHSTSVAARVAAVMPPTQMPQKAGHKNVSTGPDGLRIGLCLSGGGFRAALYGLGVVRYLAEAGLLAHVEAVSAVSGGSVAAAVLADRWPALSQRDFSVDAYIEEVDRPFHEAVTQHSARNRALRRWAFRRATLRGPTRGSAMGEVLVEQFLHARRVVDLDPALQVVLTSTELSTGRAFRVSRDFVGSFDFDYQRPTDDLSLGTAVAASAAVPLLFPPVYLRTDGLGLKDPPGVLSLVDGGVYDNLGLEWFQGWEAGRPVAARPVDFILVVDASGPLGRAPSPLRGIRAISRSRAIQYFQTRASRSRWFVGRLLDDELMGNYLVASADPCEFIGPDRALAKRKLYDGALPAGFGALLAGLRTDLDQFLPEEAHLLRYHGYWSAHVRMKLFYPQFALPGEPAWRDFADLPGDRAAALQKLLRQGAKRRPWR